MMYELLVQLADVNPMLRRGELIEAYPAGWLWKNRELTNPNWQIVRADVLETHIGTLFSLNDKHEKRYYIDLGMFPNPALYEGERVLGIIDELGDTVRAATKERT